MLLLVAQLVPILVLGWAHLLLLDVVILGQLW